MNPRKDPEKENGHEMFSRRDFVKYTGTIIFVMGSGFYVHAGKSPGNLSKMETYGWWTKPNALAVETV